MTIEQSIRTSHSETRYAATIFLAAVAGWVDAVSFVLWHGLYVSFMSGNTTSFAVSLAGHNWAETARRASVLAAFVFGIACGALLGWAVPPRRAQSVPIAEAVLLVICALVSRALGPVAAVPVLLAIAMGMQNEALRRTGRYSIALTYVTGTIVRFGRGLASAACGHGSWSGIMPYFAVWTAFLAGALAGAFAASFTDMGAMLFPALLLLAFAIWNPNGRTKEAKAFGSHA